jgi:hypothetical protein
MYGNHEVQQQCIDMHLTLATEVAAAYRALVRTPLGDFPNLPPLPPQDDVTYTQKFEERQTAVTEYAARIEQVKARREGNLTVATEIHMKDVLKPWLRGVEATLAQSGGPYLLGKMVSVADIFVFHLLSLHLGLRAEVLKEHPAARTLFLEVGSSERVGAYMASTKRLSYANPLTALWGSAAHPEESAENPFKDVDAPAAPPAIS